MNDRTQVVLRPANPGDAGSVAALHADSWRRHYRGAYSDDFLDGDVRADRLRVWTERLAGDTSNTATTVAEHNGAVVGFVHVVFDEDAKWGSLVDNLHVSRKRAGIGKRLMAEAALSVIAHGSGGLYLWVLEQNLDAQAFYRALGGASADRRPVVAPGAVPSRLEGSPAGLRYVWPDPAVLAP